MAEVVSCSEPGMYSELHGFNPGHRIKDPPEYTHAYSAFLTPWRKSTFLFVVADLLGSVLLLGLHVMAYAAKYWSGVMAL